MPWCTALRARARVGRRRRLRLGAAGAGAGRGYTRRASWGSRGARWLEWGGTSLFLRGAAGIQQPRRPPDSCTPVARRVGAYAALLTCMVDLAVHANTPRLQQAVGHAARDLDGHWGWARLGFYYAPDVLNTCVAIISIEQTCKQTL